MTERFAHLNPQDPDDLKQGTETHQVVEKAEGLVLRIPLALDVLFSCCDVGVVICWLHGLEEPDHYL